MGENLTYVSDGLSHHKMRYSWFFFSAACLLVCVDCLCLCEHVLHMCVNTVADTESDDGSWSEIDEIREPQQQISGKVLQYLRVVDCD